MSDTKAGPLEYRQRYGNQIEAMETHLDGRQAQIHTALPGHIVSYNPATMTASVQIGIQAIHQQIDGTLKAVTIAPVGDVPVHFPGGGGHTLTFPVKAGDECLVIFSERAIDNWHQHGGLQKPSDYRMHDLSDAFVLVGTRSQPKVLGASSGGTRAAAPPASATTTQIRSDDGKTFIEIDGAGGTLTMKCATRITLDSPTVHVTGTVACDAEVIAQAQTMGYVTLSKHANHQGGGQNNPPIPGT